MRFGQVISERTRIADLDLSVLGGRNLMMGLRESVFEFLTIEVSKAGGLATIEVDLDEVSVEWIAPSVYTAVGGDGSSGDVQQISYVSHLLQAGLMKNPAMAIANTAYAGSLKMLATNLLSIATTGKNRELAERDAQFLVAAAPMSVTALSFLGLILLDNGKRDEAASAFIKALVIYPDDHLSRKYLAIVLTTTDPGRAALLCEGCLETYEGLGVAPDMHMRVTYGMALLADGRVDEAGKQFELAGVSREPRMTPEQWAHGGYCIADADLPLALGSNGIT